MSTDDEYEVRIAALTAENVDLKATLVRTQAAAKSGMDAATNVGHWQIEEARRLKKECSPALIASEREVNDRLTNEVARLTDDLAIARKGIAAVSALIISAHGVCGLHLNGDDAPWDELSTG